MRVFAALAGVLSGLALQVLPVHAEYHGHYLAEISAQDLRNSAGRPLTTVAAILRQDRANVHRHGMADRFDEVDGYFNDAGLRADLEIAVANSAVADDLARSIRAGAARIRVEVYGTGNRIGYVKLHRAD